MGSTLIHGLCGVPLFYKKKLKNSKASNNVASENNAVMPKFNNSRSNLELASSLINGGLILAFILYFIVAPYVWNLGSDSGQVVVPTILSWIILIGTATVVFSLKLIITKPEIIEHIKYCMNLN